MADLLAEVVRATTSATDSATMLDRVARLLTGLADWVIADRLDDPDLVTRVAAYDGDGPLALPAGMGAASARRSSAHSAGVLPSAVDGPRPYLLLREPDLRAMAGSDDAHRARQGRMALGFGSREVLVLPVTARESAVAVLTLGSRTAFDPGAVTLLADVVAHLAAALDADRLLAVQRAVATAMQTSLLPPLPVVPGLRLAARYTPAARGLDVGGDWYDVFATGDDVVVVVGDISGHDVSAAARMAALRHLLRAHAVDRTEPPAAVVARLERTSDVLDLDATGTCVVGRLHPLEQGAWHLTWTNAGHLPPVHVRGGRSRLLDTEVDLMLGVQPGTARHDHEQVLLPGDVLLLYTDGLVEVRGASLDGRLEELRAAAGALAGQDPDVVVDSLLAQLTSGGPDDVALLAIQVAPPA